MIGQKYLITFPNISANTDIIPDINDILPAFTNPFKIPQWGLDDLGISWPPHVLLPDLPNLPTIPTPFSLHMPTIDMPSFSAIQSAGGVLVGQFLNVLNEMFNKLKLFVAAIPFPSFPGFPGIKLPELLSCNPLDLLDTIRMPDFDFDLIPNLPDLWPSFDSPDMKTFHALQSAVTGYIMSLINTVKTQITNFLGYLNSLNISFPAFPTLPSIPTWGQIKNMLPDSPSMSDLFDLNIPGFPNFTLPQPLIPNFDMTEFDFTFAYNQLNISMLGSWLKTLKNYMLSLPLISTVLHFPSISDWMGTLPTIPSICHESVNSGIECFS